MTFIAPLNPHVRWQLCVVSVGLRVKVSVTWNVVSGHLLMDGTHGQSIVVVCFFVFMKRLRLYSDHDSD